MAIEDIFVATAIQAVGMTGVFVYLQYRETNWVLRQVWTFAILASLYYGFAIQRFGFTKVAVITDLGDLTFAIIQILQYMMLSVIAYIILSMFYQGIRIFMDIVKGRSEYGKTEKIGKY